MTKGELLERGISVDDAAAARLAAFIDVLLDENQRINLTAIRTAERAWPLHVCDSLAILPTIDAIVARGATRMKVIDLGSGGGVPGIPIACARPGVDVMLVDSTAKKVRAAQAIADRIGLTNVRSTWGRAEQVGGLREQRGRYDVVTARAVAALDTLVGYAAPFVAAGGAAVFYKSLNELDAEIRAGSAAARRGRLRYEGVVEYELPEPHGRRGLVVYRRE